MGPPGQSARESVEIARPSAATSATGERAMTTLIGTASVRSAGDATTIAATSGTIGACATTTSGTGAASAMTMRTAATAIATTGATTAASGTATTAATDEMTAMIATEIDATTATAATIGLRNGGSTPTTGASKFLRSDSTCPRRSPVHSQLSASGNRPRGIPSCRRAAADSVVAGR